MALPDGGVEHPAKLNIWLGRQGIAGYDAEAEFVRLTDALRLVQDHAAAARPTPAAAANAASMLEHVAAILREFEVGEADQVAARIHDNAGRGQTLLPPFHVDSWGPTWIEGRVRFTRFHLGSNGAAHGGSISLLFDDLLGQLANAPGNDRARTARIEVSFRQITPLDRDLTVSVRAARRDGRKLVVTGELRDAATVLATAEGLFIALRPGQP
ncbi:PaaI family thioesterase [Dactylosporangium sp. CA-233914]|uniref:PaaI family thioesterase n=1 Tax=Dactylosporangium sp. CA-233914 TaxID=3239934 RepID=UPI003D8E609A